MIWRTRLSSLAVSTRPQNVTAFSKCLALLQRLPASGAVESRLDHLGEKVQRNLSRQLGRRKWPISRRPISNRPADVCENLSAKYPHSFRAHLWQDESYDRLVRNDTEFERIVHYIERNPVTAGLVGIPEEFPWSSARPIDNRPQVDNLPHISICHLL